MLAMIEIGYHFASQLRDLSDEHFEQVRSLLLNINIPSNAREDSGWYYGVGEKLVSLETLQTLTLFGLKPLITRINSMSGRDLQGQIVRDKMDAVMQIHISNVALLEVAAVDVLEDCCTKNLQEHLDNGWRIIAICPPVGTRRPTYIIGHKDSSARR